MKSAIIGLFVLVAIALTFEESEARLVCTRRICDTVRCAKQKCTAKQVLVKKGGFCGCCDLCVTILKEGENCADIFWRNSINSEMWRRTSVYQRSL
ncbi:unnamed protein product [Acanthoscelides obtectus]|uniref:Uncharacterized protein n=1 Tax=Acanthoscelides obtectus TaxID=200917 RepID=A0A9P0KHQ7_ACAOB|nr:unnamed protein product [Acanthoscelides obtectus]CAK1654710.1 hypothetical protein AOBTE_LOCUS18784 [Acanthoscelides obtectus]